MNSLLEHGLYLLRAKASVARQSFTVISQQADTATVKIGEQTKQCVFRDKLSSAADCIIFCENTLENAQLLADNWDSYITYPNCMVYFVDVKTGHKWCIKPSIHDKIAERRTLKTGILAMYDQSRQ